MKCQGLCRRRSSSDSMERSQSPFPGPSGPAAGLRGMVSSALQSRRGQALDGQVADHPAADRSACPAVHPPHHALLCALTLLCLSPCSDCQVDQGFVKIVMQSRSLVTGLCRHDHAWSQAVGIPHLFLGSLQDGSWGDAEERPPERSTQALRRHAACTLHLWDLTHMCLTCPHVHRTGWFRVAAHIPHQQD